jgi:hypothetical protein
MLASGDPDVGWLRNGTRSEISIRDWETTIKRFGTLASSWFRRQATNHGLLTAKGATNRDLRLWDPTHRLTEETWRETVPTLTTAYRRPRPRPADPLTPQRRPLSRQSYLWKRVNLLLGAGSDVAAWEKNALGKSTLRIRSWTTTIKAVLPGVKHDAFRRLAQLHGLLTPTDNDDLIIHDPTGRITADTWTTGPPQILAPTTPSVDDDVLRTLTALGVF